MRWSEEAGVCGRSAATLDHVADFYNRYPGEAVTFYTRVRVAEPIKGAVLSILLPEALSLDRYRSPPDMGGVKVQIQEDGDSRHLIWTPAMVLPGCDYEFQTVARVQGVVHDTVLESRAALVHDGQVLAAEIASVSVWTKARYLRYLPELYERDELMGRLLMLFESFWSPLDVQVKGIYNYFDPGTAPPHFLPWLASWVGVELSEGLTEEQWRRLIRRAVSLHRRRGTKEGLRECLEIYSGGRVEIVEHRARDLRLGPEARLGPGIALGTDNRPHTFTVTVYLEQEGEEQFNRAKERTLVALIEAEKPAHTGYTLRIKEPARDE